LWQFSVKGEHVMDTGFTSHYESVITNQNRESVKGQAYSYMNQLIGWCSHQKAAVLIDLILDHKPQTVVEIGVWGGMSLIPMAYALKMNGSGRIFGIDPWDSADSLEGMVNQNNISYWNTVNHESIFQGLNQKIAHFGLQNQISLIRSTSADTPPIPSIDILHVDGNHSDWSSYLDVTKWVPYVKPGGWIIFDDMTWYEEGVFTTARAVGWLDQHCIKVVEYQDNCLWGIWRKR
jgi:predicted O-methyltransferase YrrM